MINPRVVSLIIIVIIIFAFPDTPAPLAGHHHLDDVVAEELAGLALLNTTQYGAFNPQEDRWLNLTGLRKEDEYAWGALSAVKERVKERVGHILGQEHAAIALDGKNADSLPIYRNVTGHVQGSWVRSALEKDIKRPHLNMTALLPADARLEHPFQRNITGKSGHLRFDFSGKGRVEVINGQVVQNMKADVVISDETSAGDGWTVVLYGHHFVESGHILLSTTSEKLAGIFALPHFAVSEHIFSSSQQAVYKMLNRTVERQISRTLPNLNPWSSSIDGAADNAYTPHCDLIVYLQEHPLEVPLANGAPSTPKPSLIHITENELRFPAGHSSLEAPQLTMSAMIFSPDCGFVIESKGPPDYAPSDGVHLRGEKWEVYIRASINHTLLYGAALALQILLTVAQMKHSSTPSTRSRISFYSIGLLSLGDGFIGMAFLPLGMLIDSAFPALLTTAFFAFLAVTFFDMRFLLDVWSVQAQERRRQERQERGATNNSTPPRSASATPASVPIITAAGADTLPLPITSRQAINSGATPIFLPSDQDVTEPATTTANPTNEAANTRRELGTLYGKFYLILLGITFLCLHATSWYPRLRSSFTNFLVFIYLSMWCPQIYRNVLRNCRKALLWKFILGQSLLRLLPIAYFYTVPNNVLWVRNDNNTFLILAGWVWIQVCVLVVQEVLGPRLFVPQNLVPPAYDYHPILREDEEAAKMPIGFTQTTTTSPSSPISIHSTVSTHSSPSTASHPAESKDKTKRIFDCAICMQNIEVSVVSAGNGSGAGSSLNGNFLARRMYMVTPCRHIFHTECLESAMRYRLQCPICRETLPPL